MNFAYKKLSGEPPPVARQLPVGCSPVIAGKWTAALSKQSARQMGRKKPFAIAFGNNSHWRKIFHLNRFQSVSIGFSRFQSVVPARFVSDLSALKEGKNPSLSHSGINKHPFAKNNRLRSFLIDFSRFQ